MKSLLLWFWYLDTRFGEVIIGLELLRRGTLWATGAAPMQSASYGSMVDVMPSGFWGLLFLIVGAVQLSGIMINGNWHRSPYLRMSALLFSTMAFTLLGQVFGQGITNPGAALQSSTQQYLIALVCLWSLLNIASKQDRHV